MHGHPEMQDGGSEELKDAQYGKTQGEEELYQMRPQRLDRSRSSMTLWSMLRFPKTMRDH